MNKSEVKKMGKYYLAIDIGASSGRHIIAELVDGKIQLEEIHRFWNGMEDNGGSKCWDVNRLFNEIVTGIKKCKEIGKIPSYMGIDTWAVDYVLLDKNDELVGKTYGYRDDRTAGMDDKVYEIIPKDELYARTGIQKQIFNTIYQLMAVKQNNPEHLEQAESLLMLPDYFNFLLTGVKKTEYSNASSTNLLNPHTKEWDYELIERLGYPTRIFDKVQKPGVPVGHFSAKIQEEVGFDCEVILTTTHDTASAVVAVPTHDDNGIYISSGTWSLMGVELMEANCSMESMKENFTNEGGYDYRFRFIKNIMGLWMIQSVRYEFPKVFPEYPELLSFGEICGMASKETIESIVDCNDDCFLAPDSMIQAVKDFCANTNQQVPETVGEIASVIYNSLAKCYGNTIAGLESVTGKTFDRIHVVGGGANAGYLNELTAKATGKTVLAGPTEATALGNLAVQMMYAGDFKDLVDARTCIRNSFDIVVYEN